MVSIGPGIQTLGIELPSSKDDEHIECLDACGSFRLGIRAHMWKSWVRFLGILRLIFGMLEWEGHIICKKWTDVIKTTCILGFEERHMEL